MRAFLTSTSLIVALLAGAVPIAAQSPFAPVIQVNDRGVTGFEIDQRARFLSLLGAQGDLLEMAETALIEDRLRMQAAQEMGISVSPEQVKAGMEEFAGRANLSAEEFLKAIAPAGVQPETFRDFVEAGFVWRETVRKRFADSVRISEAEVDRILEQSGSAERSPRLLVTEFVVPLREGREAEARARIREAAAAPDEDSFSRMARTYSIAPTRTDGGRLGWLPLDALPEDVQGPLARLKPGQHTAPIQMNDTLVVLWLRELEPARREGAGLVDYALVNLVGSVDPARAAGALRQRADACDTLYTAAAALPSGQVVREKLPRAAIPADIRGALDAMDAGESQVVQRAQGPAFVMLCSRFAVEKDGAETPDRNRVRAGLTNARLGALAAAWLADLKAQAIIRRN